MGAATSGGVTVVLHSGVQSEPTPLDSGGCARSRTDEGCGRGFSTPSTPALRPGDDTMELEPQDDDEIGPTSLYDAEGKVRHPSALDHPRALQVDRPGAKVVEQ